LIAVLLSAQCTDARVNLVTPKLFALANTPEQMIALDLAQIEEIIRPCGLFRTKAKAIWNLSKDLIEKHLGRVPKNFEALEALPGVGHKTASVVMAQAFHEPAFPVDTHIHRCAKRWGLCCRRHETLILGSSETKANRSKALRTRRPFPNGKGDEEDRLDKVVASPKSKFHADGSISQAKSVSQTEKDLKKLFPRSNWIKIHLQIIYFARKFCKARGHDQEACPICGKMKQSQL
jgi:endonuclease-3